MKAALNIRKVVQHGLGTLALCLATASQAHDGVLEIHGLVTSPSCKLNSTALVLQDKQSSIDGKACGLTSNTNNPMAVLTIARIGEAQIVSANHAAVVKKMVTITYD